MSVLIIAWQPGLFFMVWTLHGWPSEQRPDGGEAAMPGEVGIAGLHKGP